jgi:hypothetical protein
MRRFVLPSVAGAVLTTGAVLGVGSAGADPAPPVPSAEQLTTQLQAVLNPGADQAARAAALQGGAAAIPTADNIANQMNRYASMVDWHVQNPSVSGDQLNAELAVSVPVMGTRTHQIFWVAQDGRWKLSNASACVIATQVAGTNCTV